MITWPAMLKYDQDDDLIYIADRNEWENDAHLNSYDYQDLDILIDSAGMIYSLMICASTDKPISANTRSCVLPEPSGTVIELSAAIKLIQAHFSLLGSCCAAKISAPSIATLIHMLGADDGS